MDPYRLRIRPGQQPRDGQVLVQVGPVEAALARTDPAVRPLFRRRLIQRGGPAQRDTQVEVRR
jgi:hypothetical protein